VLLVCIQQKMPGGKHKAHHEEWDADSSTGSRDPAVLRTERSRIARWLSEAMKLRRYDYSTEHEGYLRGRMGGGC
jgi:hypothetical protein